jgi:transposase
MVLNARIEALLPTFSLEGQALVLDQQQENLRLRQQDEAQQKELSELKGKLEELQSELRELKRMLFGQKAEPKPRLKPPEKPEATQEEKESREEKRKESRAEKQQARAEMPTEEVILSLPPEKQVCPKCQGTDFRKLGEGETKIDYDFVQAHIRRRRIVREKWACRCGECILTAPALPTVGEGSLYSPALHAHVVVAKCADSLPLYRQEKILARAGLPIDRNTLLELFHRAARELRVIYNRMEGLLPEYELIHADETTLKVQEQEKCRTGWIWVFLAGPMAFYVFSASRSGQTPMRLLGDSDGILQVDGYTGYNEVTTPERRERAGCWAHARRKFWPVLNTDGKALAEWALEQIGQFYKMEYRAEERQIVGSPAHLRLRQECSGPVLKQLEAWVDQELPKARPSSPLYKALNYLKNQRESLRVFLKDVKVSLDNNVSERALRVIALGRKNFMFAGHDEGAENLAVLQTLVGSCVLAGVNPETYIADVLIRVQTCPQDQIDTLLPWNWKPRPAS